MFSLLMAHWISILIAIGSGALLYYFRQIYKIYMDSIKTEPFFPENEAVKEYMLLIDQEPSNQPEATRNNICAGGYRTSFDFSELEDPSGAVNKVLLPKNKEFNQKLQNALVRRAMEAVRRMRRIQEEKPSIMNLNASGALSESFQASFFAAETETMEEIFSVRSEAEILKEGWSKTILQQAVTLMTQLDAMKPTGQAATGTGSSPVSSPTLANSSTIAAAGSTNKSTSKTAGPPQSSKKKFVKK